MHIKLENSDLKKINSAVNRVRLLPRGPAGVCPLKGTTCANESMLNASLCGVTTMPTIWD